MYIIIIKYTINYYNNKLRMCIQDRAEQNENYPELQQKTWVNLFSKYREILARLWYKLQTVISHLLKRIKNHSSQPSLAKADNDLTDFFFLT